MESRRGICQSNVVDAVLDLPPIAVVLAFDAGCMVTALGRSGLVDTADSHGTRVLGGDDMLALISQLLFIPNNGLQEPL